VLLLGFLGDPRLVHTVRHLVKVEEVD